MDHKNSIPKQVSQPSIEGMVILKRKSLWVRRFAKIENHIFSYKKDKSKHIVMEKCGE